MNLKERNYSTKKRAGKKKLLIFATMCCILFAMSITAFAASKHTTRPSLTVVNGHYNPFVHDTAKFTVQFCTYHKKKPNNSKVQATVQVKTNKRNSKVITKTYDSLAKGTVEGAPAYTEYNKGDVVKLKIKTNVSDKYTAYARYSTRDFYCVSCQVKYLLDDADSYAKYCNLSYCKWKKEK